MTYDVIVIGGGPSGLMAAIAASRKGANVLLLEKGKKLGRKLLLSGGGRCNVTNRLTKEEIIKHIPGNGRFLYSAFSEFDNEDIISFFEDLGVKLKEEDHGRMFPVTDSAQTVLDAMLNELSNKKVTIQLESPVKKLIHDDTGIKGVRLQNNDEYLAKSIVLAVGGKSVPQTGSTGDGYEWAKKLNHTVTPLFPTEVPITSNESFIKDKTLQGLSLRDVALRVHNKKGKIVISHTMDMIFTHFGISGPAALRCSSFIYQTQLRDKTTEVTVSIDSLPEENGEQLFQKLYSLAKEEGKKSVKNIWKGIVPERYLLFLLEKAGIDEHVEGSHCKTEDIRVLASLLKKFTFTVNGTLPMEKAFVTGGGISIKEVNPKEMSSKFVNGLYFCGELLDIHGYTGGYNITSALVTGNIAGSNAALNALENI